MSNLWRWKKKELATWWRAGLRQTCCFRVHISMDERVLSLAFCIFFLCFGAIIALCIRHQSGFSHLESMIFHSTLNELETLCTNDRRQVGRVTDKTSEVSQFFTLTTAVCHNADLLISNFISCYHIYSSFALISDSIRYRSLSSYDIAIQQWFHANAFHHSSRWPCRVHLTIKVSVSLVSSEVSSRHTIYS